MKRAGWILTFSLLATSAAQGQLLQIGGELPRMAGEYLTKDKSELPKDARGRAALLVLGFTYGSREAVEKVTTAFRERYGDEPKLTYFQAPFVGGFGRFFAIRGIRSDTPHELKPNVMVVSNDINGWKARVGFYKKADDDAYLVLIDSDGIVRWMAHGSESEELMGRVASQCSAATIVPVPQRADKQPLKPRGVARREFVKSIGAAAASLAPSIRPASAAEEDFSYESDWRGSRVWVGPEFWANPLQSWRVDDGEVVARAGAGRTLHLLTHQVGDGGGGFAMEATVRVVRSNADQESLDTTWAGFVFGVRGGLSGYQHALIHSEESVPAGLRGDGRLFCGDVASDGVASIDWPVRLKLAVRPTRFGYEAEVSAESVSGGPATKVVAALDAAQLPGNLALAAQAPGQPDAETSSVEWRFRDWKVGGPQVEAHPDQTFGPILWTQYTLSRGTLKVAALFPPLGDSDDWTSRLQVRQSDGRWKTAAEAPIERLSRTAVFRIDDWDDRSDREYRVAYRWLGEDRYWGGVVRRDPRDERELKVGVFSCDHGEVFPQHRLVGNVAIQDPDIVFFAGDQIYEVYGGFGVARGKPSEEAMLDYLRKYWQFGWTWRSILKDRPSIISPDDHDVFQGNIWGQGGRPLPVSADGRGFENGGFLMEADWVNAVQRTQAGHLPDAVDPEPCEGGIEVYFTELRYGGASFAIIEDRKFKTGPGSILTPEQRAQGADQPEMLDVEGAELLGTRQEAFLRELVADSADADFRFVCTQTIFCKATTHAGGNLDRRLIDLDCGGWPQSGRRVALSILQPVRDVIMLHGDQHIGSLLRHGIDDWEDGPLAFMVPGTSNGFPRAWWPEHAGENHQPGAPEWTGRYRDGLGNRMTVLGVANPEPNSNTRGGKRGLDAEEVAHRKGSGHGLVVLDREARTATFEIWRHAFDARQPRPEDQFPGFPVKISLPA